MTGLAEREDLLREIDVLHALNAALDHLAQVVGLGKSSGGGEPIEAVIVNSPMSDYRWRPRNEAPGTGLNEMGSAGMKPRSA